MLQAVVVYYVYNEESLLPLLLSAKIEHLNKQRRLTMSVTRILWALIFKLPSIYPNQPVSFVLK